MRLPKRIDIFHAPTLTAVDARIVSLTRRMIETRMGDAWWEMTEIDTERAEGEIDRHWDWNSLTIERDGKVLRSRKIAVATGDGVVQGAAMYSTGPVESTLKEGQQALFVEMLFTAPRNRLWLCRDRIEQYRGVGIELLRAMSEESRSKGYSGRLKLDSSPGFVGWYVKRGLQQVPEKPIVHEGVQYTPMELSAEAAARLLSVA